MNREIARQNAGPQRCAQTGASVNAIPSAYILIHSRLNVSQHAFCAGM